jgi:hypothetical protein
MFCAYCGIDHDESVEFTEEHVVPYALGGSNVLTIRVCGYSNNTLGGLLDKPFIEMFPVRANRFFLGLCGTDGTEPTLDLGGKSQIQGKDVRIDYAITKDSKELRIVTPAVIKTAAEDGEHWAVSGDPKKVREIIEGKLKSLKTEGKWMKSEAGKVLRLEDLDALFQNAARVQVINPSVVKTVTVDLLACIGFFAKLALSTGHYMLGESFSRSSVAADVLRRAMRAKDLETARIPHALIWPNIGGQEALLALFDLFRKKDSHVLGILDGEPPIFFASLFGIYDAFIPLGVLETGETPKPSNDGRILQIELPSRTLHDRRLVEYLAVLLDARGVP